MTKYQRIAIIGGGSALWVPGVVAGMACTRSLREAHVVLMDADAARARRMAETVKAVLRRGYPGTPTPTVSGTGSLEEALADAEAVYTCYRNLGHDTEGRINDLAKKYGSRQACFTAGPGACIYLATQGTVMLEVLRSMIRLCPKAWLINVSNPLPGLSILAAKAGADPRRVLGVCGTLEGYRQALADFLRIEPARLTFTIGGTNHCTFYTGVWIDGREAYEQVRQRAREQPYLDLGRWGTDTGPVELLELTGYMAVPGHPDDIYPMLRCERRFPAGPSPTLMPWERADFGQVLEAYGRGETVDFEPPREPSQQVQWLESLAGVPNVPRRFSVNTANLGVWPNMPSWSVLDMECELDERGVMPLATPPLPETIAEVARAHQVSFELAARAVVNRDRNLLVQAIRSCPFGNYMQSAEAMVQEAWDQFSLGKIF